jgi:hypothetical protein
MGSPEPVALPIQSVGDEIAKLRGLLDSGALTQQEFEAAKQRVLGRAA